MKTTLTLIALTLASCSTPEENARLGSLVDLAIAVAESRGAISAKDAADIRAAETIILPPITIEATSGK
jgi:uncharacterized lipoprotein YmbA